MLENRYFKMKNKIKFPFLNLSTGLIAMLCALCLQNITLSTGNYAGILLAAFCLGMLSVFCLLKAYRRGGVCSKVIAILLILPMGFIISDTISRVF